MTSKFTVATRDIAVLFELKTLLISGKEKACILHLSHSCLPQWSFSQRGSCGEQLTQRRGWICSYVVVKPNQEMWFAGLTRYPWTDRWLREAHLITSNHAPAPFVCPKWFLRSKTSQRCSHTKESRSSSQTQLLLAEEWSRAMEQSLIPGHCGDDGSGPRAARVLAQADHPDIGKGLCPGTWRAEHPCSPHHRLGAFWQVCPHSLALQPPHVSPSSYQESQPVMSLCSKCPSLGAGSKSNFCLTHSPHSSWCQCQSQPHLPHPTEGPSPRAAPHLHPGSWLGWAKLDCETSLNQAGSFCWAARRGAGFVMSCWPRELGQEEQEVRVAELVLLPKESLVQV